MEPQLHFLEERQRALMRSKQSGGWSDFFAVAIACFFLIDSIIACVQSFPHWRTIPSVAHSLLGNDVGIVAVGLTMSLLAWAIIDVQGKLLNITGWEPITSLPAWYLLCSGVVVLAAVLSLLPGDFSFMGRLNLTTCLIFLLLERKKVRKKERRQAQAALATKNETKKEVADTAQPSKQCEVCKQKSLYDLCLSCENKHRGERQRVRAQILRAKRAGVSATLTLPQWLETLETFHHHCAYCSGPYQLMEHYIPITEGGGTTQENCVPGCFSCNSKKSNKHPEA